MIALLGYFIQVNRMLYKIMSMWLLCEGMLYRIIAWHTRCWPCDCSVRVYYTGESHNIQDNVYVIAMLVYGIQENRMTYKIYIYKIKPRTYKWRLLHSIPVSVMVMNVIALLCRYMYQCCSNKKRYVNGKIIIICCF